MYIYIYYTYKLELKTADFVGYGPTSLHYPILKHSQNTTPYSTADRFLQRDL